MKGNTELHVLFLALPGGASSYEEVMVQPSEERGTVSNLHTILTSGPTDVADNPVTTMH